jgi:sRNA-binding protein
MPEPQNQAPEPGTEPTSNPAVEAIDAAPLAATPEATAVAVEGSDLPVAPEATAPAAEVTAAEVAAVEAPAAPAAPAVPDLPPAVVAAKLGELFPALFAAGRALPIKLRIQADIQQRAPGLFNKKSLSVFLHRHTTSTGYLKSLAQAPARLDLDGQPAGDIAQEHRDAAAAELTRRLAIVQERRVAERKAQRQGERQGERPAAVPQTPVVAQDGSTPAPDAPQGERPARPPRPDRPPRGDRPPRPARPDAGPDARPPRPEQRPGQRSEQRPEQRRDPRPDSRPGPRPDSRQDRPPRPDRPDRPDRFTPQAQASQEPAAPRVPLTPEQAAELDARRARALVLRAFETTTLTRANFCALKGMSDAALEAVLVQARADRGERGERADRVEAPRAGPGRR